MATVATSCPDCGDIRVPSRDAAVVRIAHHAGPDRLLYRLTCPECQRIVLKPCEPATAELMLGCNAAEVEIVITPDRPSPLRSDPITDDECITVHALIHGDDATVWQLFDVVADMHGDES